MNHSGDDAVLFGGPGNLAFGSRGYAWLTNNVVQGTPNSNYFVMALKPNGEPADGTNGTPTSPFMEHPGDCDPTPNPPGNGSFSQFDLSGTAISGPEGYYDGTLRVQGMSSDAQ